MEKKEILMKNEEAVRDFGREMGKNLSSGSIVALTGDLGTGKTTLTKAIAEGLGVTETITSPTFNIVKQYESGRLPLYHFDVYRIGDVEEMYELGYEEYFFGSGICVIEWAELIDEIVPEEAATVRWIFDAYLKGRSSGWIAEQLTAKGIPSQSGAECWRETGIRYLLTNEKYIGDALSQKSYSCGFPFVQKRNHGERLQYYTENSHPAIIDRDTFERVQALLQKKAQKEKKRREKSPLALKIVCGNCGTVFQRRSSQNGYVTWVCRTHDRHAADCPVGRIPETEIHAAFLRMYHRLKSNADIILAPALRQLNTLDTILRQNHPQVLAINRAIAEATEESHKISTLRANGLLDADICAARMNAISARLAQLRGERRRLTENEVIDETMDALRKVEQTLLNGPERLDGFDEELFEHLVEKIIAESQNRIRFRLYGGLELTEQWEVAAR